jgi:hypothetical protein
MFFFFKKRESFTGGIFRHKVKESVSEVIGGNFRQEIYWHTFYWQIDSARKFTLFGGNKHFVRENYCH